MHTCHVCDSICLSIILKIFPTLFIPELISSQYLISIRVTLKQPGTTATSLKPLVKGLEQVNKILPATKWKLCLTIWQIAYVF